MFRFLHVSDIHLGHRLYNQKTLEEDHYQALRAVLNPQFLAAESIDFVLIGGDLFERRNISADVFLQASSIFRGAADAGVPVIAIEGNHDYKDSKHYISDQGSWYHALASHGLLDFLYEPGDQVVPYSTEGGRVRGNHKRLHIRGHTVDIIGSRWNSFAMSATISGVYAEQLGVLRVDNPSDFCIFLLHGGHQRHYPSGSGMLESADLARLEGVVDYVALGHIHKFYIEPDQQGRDFIFNPGSLVPSNIGEADDRRGALVVTVADDHTASYELYTDYPRRKFCRLAYSRDSFADLGDLMDRIASELSGVGSASLLPVLEVRLHDDAHPSDLTPKDLYELENKLVADRLAIHAKISVIGGQSGHTAEPGISTGDGGGGSGADIESDELERLLVGRQQYSASLHHALTELRRHGTSPSRTVAETLLMIENLPESM